MTSLRKIGKKMPVFLFLYRKLRSAYVRRRYRSKDAEQVFNDIYRKNTWGGKESVSGTGSDKEQTEVLVNELPDLIRDLGIRTMLDIPCGDFHWMKNVDLSGIKYIGGDIVEELVTQNVKEYERKSRRFKKLDLINDELPKVDLVFCRDCLVHLSFDEIFRSLGNIFKSDSKYLLTTTFPEKAKNYDIATGQWRALNLELPPFSLPKPLRIIHEDCGEADGEHADKALGLWDINDLKNEMKI